ncbi:hypothetical protein OSSY52_04790 [Tepiditoga spiralis]|uniref:DUF4203 domain-containing protein n=1 Tax=Tepiditoga spiralis TaxID=2108365 RepID=A0A7G1G276_9BACT|nr:hypothetical protein [Tepiditoga spiralis]BBE30338.1 hypothetical protein OSSY52_04790 [Tepiditoga spiralis]
MEELNQVTKFISNYYDVLISSWYVLFPIAAFFVFFSKLSSKISIFLIGMYMSYTILIPYAMKLEQIKNLLEKYTDYKFMIFLIVSIIFGIIFYSLVKVAIIISGFTMGGLLGFALGNFLVSSNPEFLTKLPFDSSYIPWMGLVIIGLIVAFIISKDFEKMIAALSVIFGSLMMSFYTLFLLEKYSSLKIGDNTILMSLESISRPETITFLGCFIVYMAIGFFFIMRKGK